MATTQINPRLTRQTYNRLVYAIVGTGILGLLIGLAINQQFVGTLVYLLGAWIGGGIAVVAPWWSDTKLQDERDYDLHNRASGLAMGITMVFGVGLVPALYVLDAGEYFALTEAMWGAIFLASALFLLYGVCFGIVKRRN
jgi:undecaprenyl pyrophosphate phosphatase UppP